MGGFLSKKSMFCNPYPYYMLIVQNRKDCECAFVKKKYKKEAGI